ncbi:MAG: hypothetical protein AAGC44_06265 [Planctomycetota bacterium]
MQARTRHNPKQLYGQRGTAYIVALLVVTVLAAVALVFARQMRTEALVASNQTAHSQARWIALGVLEAVRGDLTQSLQNGEYPRLDTVEAEGGQMAGGYYWIIGRGETDRGYTFGLIGESSKLNLNTVNYEELIELPGVSEDLAAAIIDWRDGDSDVTPGGAEADYYSAQRPGYAPRDAAFESVGELMLVKGMTYELLYGEDANRNGVLDPNERDGDENPPNDNGDNNLDPGLIDYLSVEPLERNATLSGDDRINLNQANAQTISALSTLLNERFSEKRASEILAATASIAGSITSPLQYHITANLSQAEFDALYDNIAVTGQNNLRGLVDIYTASAEVIETIQGLDPGDGELIVAGRPVLQEGEDPGAIGWLTDLIGNDKSIIIGGRLTNHSRQFTVDIVAVTADGRSFCRLRAVVNTLTVTGDEPALPRIEAIEDLTHLGWPLSPVILDQLSQEGTLPDEAVMTEVWDQEEADR